MSDDHDAAKMKERPVEPPVIDVTAQASDEDPKPEEQMESAADAPEPRSPLVSPFGRRVLAVGAVLVLAGLAVWGLSASGWRVARDDPRIAAMTQRIEALETGAGAAQQQLAELARLASETRSTLEQVSAQEPQGLDELRSRTESLENAVKSMQAAIETASVAQPASDPDGGQSAALAGRIDELQQKLADFEKRASAAAVEDGKGNELAAAFASLGTPLGGGQPFVAELERIAAISPSLVGLEDLRPHAASGAPTVADLATRLQAIADRQSAAPAVSAGAGEQGLWSGLRTRISGLVKVRDLGRARWSDGMAAALRHLARADIQQAVATLEAIEGPHPEELRAWLAEAQARAAVERAALVLAEAVRRETAGAP